MGTAAKVSTGVLLLGLVSFITDVSSEMILPLLPLFIVALGGSGIAVGLVSGVGDSVADFLKIFSGYFSDRLGRRKPLVALGYFSSALAKLFFPIATIWEHVLALRVVERIGKGVRTAPRDAMIAGYAAMEIRGKAFGVHRAMDTAGAVLGSIIAFLLLWFFALDFRQIFLAAALLAFLALLPLYFVKEVRSERRLESSFALSLKSLPADLKALILILMVFALGNISYMFFILRAREVFEAAKLAEQLSLSLPVLLYVLYNSVYATLAEPFGALSDRIGRANIMLGGFLLFSLMSLGFIFVGVRTLLILFALYGLVYAMTEGVGRAFVSDLCSEQLRGTALGAYHTATGFAAIAANLVAGVLWDVFGSEATFAYAASLPLLAALLLFFWKKKRQ
ncbi:MFS transporter [Candidatus Alkanophaga liquidiphilum]